MLDDNAKPEDYMKNYWQSFEKTLKEKSLYEELEKIKDKQAQFMKENPTKITANEKYPRLEPKLVEEDLINAEMVGQTDKKAHKYSFVHQEKVVAFLSMKIIVKDVNNLIDSKKSYINLKQLNDCASGLVIQAVAEAKFAKKEAN